MSAFAGLPPSALPVHTTLGAVFIGFAAACVIFGILTAQIFSYYRNYPGDKLSFKLLVRRVFCLRC